MVMLWITGYEIRNIYLRSKLPHFVNICPISQADYNIHIRKIVFMLFLTDYSTPGTRGPEINSGSI